MIFLFFQKIKNLFYRIKFLFCYRFFFKRTGKSNLIIDPILITPKFINLGSRVFIRNNSRMEGVSRYLNHVFTPEIIIEDNVTIEQNLHLTCANFIKIGRDTAIASNVSITDIIHPYEDIALPIDKQDIKTRDVIIGNSCKIYNNAIILPGTELGNHCVVGANTVLIGKKYRDFSVMVGNPSKVVKRYCTQVGKWKRTNFDGDFLD